MTTNGPLSNEITLTFENDHWIATDEQRDIRVEAPTREQALEALDVAVAAQTDAIDLDHEIDADDPFFTAPTFSSGSAAVSEHADAYLTDAIARDKLDSKR